MDRPWSVTTAPNGPMVYHVDPPAGASGKTVQLTVSGQHFMSGAQVILQNTAQNTSFVSASQLSGVAVLPKVSQPEVLALSVTNPDGSKSNAVPFMVMPSGENAIMQYSSGKSLQITAPTVVAQVSSDAPVSAMVANYQKNPASAAIDSSSFSDVFVKDATNKTTASLSFTVPKDVQSPQLAFFDSKSGQWANASGQASFDPQSGKLTFVADASSSPKITELSGTYFAVTKVSGNPIVNFGLPIIFGVILLIVAVTGVRRLQTLNSRSF